MTDDLDLLRRALDTSQRAYARSVRDVAKLRARVSDAEAQVAALRSRLPRITEELIHAYADTIIAAETYCRRESPETHEALRRSVRQIHAAWVAADAGEEFKR